jgi:hypothetical protein
MSFFFNPNQGPGVLTNNVGQPMPQGYMNPIMQAQAMQNGATGNARGSMRMPQMPNNRIDMNEALIRAGGNIVGAAADGPLAAFKAGTDSFGQVMDYNRQADIERFNAEQDFLKQQADRELRERIASMKRKNTSNKDAAKKDAAIAAAKANIDKIRSAEDLFRQDTDSSLTGLNLAALWSRAKGLVVGSSDEAARLFLNEVKLDSVMARVAETKGAISNAEMKLFASQAPDLNANAIVWMEWLKRQRRLAEKVLNRLQTDGTIDPNEPLSPDLGGSPGSVDDPGEYTIEEITPNK